MTRWRWIVAGVVVIAFLVGAAIVYPLMTPSDESHEARPSASPVPRPTAAEEWESVYIPGYDQTAEAFTLPDLHGADGPTVSADFDFYQTSVHTAGTVGLSFDATDLASETWASPESNLALTLNELDRPALRFGGNGVDRRMWWTSDSEPAPDWAEATVTPDDLKRVATVAERVDASLTLVLNLGSNDAERAADMAAHAQEIFGDRLLAITVGNEPNGFYHPNQPQLQLRDEDWGPDEYQDALVDYAEAVEQVAPGLPIIGPGAYDAPWWRAFAESNIPQAHALSMHWYPLWDCEGPESSIANPTVEDLTAPALRERANEIFGMARDVADTHDLPLWLEETGPTSCPGTNETSRTHAQALWTTDFVFTAWQNGVERQAFHSTLHACQGGAPMSPICARGPYDDPGQIFAGRTSYLSLMMLGWVPDGKVLTPTVSGDGEIMVHGVTGDDGSLSFMVVDQRDPTQTDDLARVEINMPGDLPADGSGSWTITQGSSLHGESLSSQESSLTAMAPFAGDRAEATLSEQSPLALASAPGSVTLLVLEETD